MTRISSLDEKDPRSAGASGTRATTVLMAFADIGYLVILVLIFLSQNTLKVFDIVLHIESKVIFIAQVPTSDKSFSSRLLKLRKFWIPVT